MAFADPTPPNFTRDAFFSTMRIFGDKVGTGFLCRPSEDGPTFLVTNRHIVEGSAELTGSLLQVDGDEPILGETVEYDIRPASRRWTFHPNRFIDIAVLNFDQLLSESLDFGSAAPYYCTISDAWGPGEDIADYNYVEDVTFIGYPSGIHDTVWMTPLVRRGITATPLQMDWMGTPAFLIDAYVVEGSSGSPVLCIHNGSFRNGSAYSIGMRAAFLGVLAKGVQNGSGTATGGSVEAWLPRYANLGVVFKWNTVTETIVESLKS